MLILLAVLAVIAVLSLVTLALSLRIVQQYEEGVLFRLGRVVGQKQPGLTWIVPIIDVLRRVSLRIVTMPIQSQGIITRDNVSVDVSAVAYFRIVDAVKSVVAIENVCVAIDQIAQTTLRKVVGQHTLDETLSETDRINKDIREILDVATLDRGVEVTLVELKDIQLPESIKRRWRGRPRRSARSEPRSLMPKVSRWRVRRARVHRRRGGAGGRGAATDRDPTRPSRGTDRRPAQQRRRTGHPHQRS
jgi:regulator of protease activity HflC (stomatin/prohibitin superfamily)